MKDAELIFENCRIYNGNTNDGYYKKAADECEKFLVSLVCKMKEYNLNFAGYKKLIGKDDEAQGNQDNENDSEQRD